MKAASSAEHMKVLAVESSNADSQYQQLDKLRMVYEEYVKLGEETIPNAENELQQLKEELDNKSQALDDVIIITFSIKYSLEVLLNFIPTCLLLPLLNVWLPEGDY